MSGYVHCGCRDCFEIAIGEVGDLCHECETAGCEADAGEYQAPGAYGSPEYVDGGWPAVQARLDARKKADHG